MRTYKTDLLWARTNWKNLALAVTGLALVVTLLKNAGEDDSKRLGQWKDWQKAAQSAVEFGNKKEKEALELFKKSQDAGAKVAKLETQLNKSKQSAAALNKQNSALYTKLARAGTLDTMLVIDRFKPVITLAENQKIEIDTLKNIVRQDSVIIFTQKTQIDWLGQAYTLSDLRGDSLETAIKNQPKLLPTECRFLKIVNCPSRKQALILGVIGGVAAATGGKIVLDNITK